MYSIGLHTKLLTKDSYILNLLYGRGRVNKLQKRNYKTLDGPDPQREFLSFFLSSSYRLEIVFHYE